MKHYHYIFAGSGLAALMTAYKMAVSGRFADKHILLIDPDEKKANDRTWCFWERGNGNWDEIMFRNWKTALFKNADFSRELDFGGYHYKMVRAADFYSFVLTELRKHPNITFAREKVVDFQDNGTQVLVKTEARNYTCDKLFNSIYKRELPASQHKYPVLQQHFVGWHVKTAIPVFNAGVPTFMDFSIAQKGNTRFMYVLPFSATEAIVEYTLFSKDLLPVEEYEAAIASYLKNLGTTEYEIIDKERGSIPMTSYKFWKQNTKNILHIGSAGGWTKASTGYTFKNSDKLSGKLISFLQTKEDFTKFHKKRKFWLYDLLLLDILARTNEKGSTIFSAMFHRGDAAPIFKFLDEETSLAEDLGVIWRCPKGLFVKALLRRLF
ncbi:lycopene cyclase family protein [Flavobacterium sp. RHBU_24]|uniref:lycopene cyclase family protein n=1 Tax=Flavobacterium sp. RHBU_24 TaxID=3391185 RepID=UPI0039851EDA